MTAMFVRFCTRILCVVAVGLVLSLVSNALTMRELDRVRRDLDARDPNWRIEPLIAAYNATLAPVPGTRHDLGPRIQSLGRLFWEECAGVIEPAWNHALEARQVPPAHLLDDVRACSANHHTAIELARSARLSRVCGQPILLAWNPLETRLPWLEESHEAAGLLSVDAVLAAIDGDNERATQNTLAIRHFADSITGQPFLIGSLKQLSLLEMTAHSIERTLAYSEPTDAQLTQLQDALRDPDYREILRCGLRGDRALFDVSLEHFRGTPQDARDFGIRFMPIRPFAGFWIPHEQRTFLQISTEVLAILDRPSHEWLTAFDQLRIRDRSFGDGLLFHGHPPSGRLRWRPLCSLLISDGREFASALRSMTHIRATRTGVACERFRRQHRRWPSQLAELTPRYLDTIPRDPYSGEPMRLARHADDVVIYATGLDRQDHRGRLPRSRSYEPEIVVRDEGIRIRSPLARRVPYRHEPEPRAESLNE